GHDRHRGRPPGERIRLRGAGAARRARAGRGPDLRRGLPRRRALRGAAARPSHGRRGAAARRARCRLPRRSRPAAVRQSDRAQPDHGDHVAGAARGDRGARAYARPDRDRGRRLRPPARAAAAAARRAGPPAHRVHRQRREDSGVRPAPWRAALAPERTVYNGSAAKSLAPDLRLGALHCPPHLLSPLADAQHDLFLTCPPLMAELFAELVRDGTAERLALRQRQEAALRQGLARQALAGHAYVAQPSGFHVWLPLPPPWRTMEFVERLAERGVVVEPATAFAVERTRAPHAVRVSLSAAASHDRLRRALDVLAEALRGMPARRREVI